MQWSLVSLCIVCAGARAWTTRTPTTWRRSGSGTASWWRLAAASTAPPSGSPPVQQQPGAATAPATATDACAPCATTDTSGAGEGRLPLVVQLDGPVLAEEIENQNLIRIVNLQCTDAECNKLAWKCLGYGYDTATDKFVLTPNVFPKWAAKYPEPPDLIGVTRNYSPDVDKVCRDASMNLMRSIPRDFKGGVREVEKEGFRGYKLKELTPNKTRRAQLVNWLIYYRTKLWGKTFEQLREERMQEEAKPDDIANLPSERNFQKLRLDEAPSEQT